jgi:uncharacterized LabA/DUF88 family protein
MPTAVVIDGAYFLRRFHHSFPNLDPACAQDLTLGVVMLAAYHVTTRLNANPVLQAIDGGEYDPAKMPRFRPEESPELYRIFFYDCPPLTKRMHTPVSNRSIVWGNTPEAKLRLALHEHLHETRKVAVRLGRLNDEFAAWRAKTEAVTKWLKAPGGFHPTDDDFELSIIQKGVDMRLGLDIASMAFKRQIDQLIMVTGDADFVPPAKLARREGIDVVLDPMHGTAARDLLQHVDGIRSCKIPGRPGK